MSLPAEIATLRTTLRTILKRDIAALEAIFSDGQTETFLPELYTIIRANNGVELLVSAFRSYLTSGLGAMWGVYAYSKLIGFVAIMDMPVAPTLFYAMHPDFRGRGYMTEALRGLIAQMRSEGLCGGISTDVYLQNIASVRLLTSLGFEAERSDDKKHYMRLTID